MATSRLSIYAGIIRERSRRSQPVLQGKRHSIGIEFLQYANKEFDTFPGIRFVRQQLTGKAFFTVKWSPGELAAVIIQESGRQTDSFFRGNVCQRCIMIRAVEVFDLTACDQPLLDGS